MIDENFPCWWSWQIIIKHADQLGVPNFQRGAIWGIGNRVALLESLYEKSPCGSFVLWDSSPDPNPHRHGSPLRQFDKTKKPMWLVDGQQRTRAMLDLFEQLLQLPSHAENASLVRTEDLSELRILGKTLLRTPYTDDDEEEDKKRESNDVSNEVEEDDRQPRLWVVVLPAMSAFDERGKSYFGEHSEARNVQRGSIFRHLRPRARTSLSQQGKEQGISALPVGIIPLASLISPVGIFNDDSLDEEICDALTAVRSSGAASDAQLETLDRQLPWGPQFVTGHAFAEPINGDNPAVLMRWSHIKSRQKEPAIVEMIKRLEDLFKAPRRKILTRFRQMLTGPHFAVGKLPNRDINAAIDAYIRINRAGIRVRPEERAMALLIRAYSGLLDDLAKFIGNRDDGKAKEDQRALLTHQSDRQMGFEVWMTVITRYTALALLGEFACKWLGVSAIDKATFEYRLDRVSSNETAVGMRTWARKNYENPEEIVQECTKRATQALLLIDSILSQELSLDHRMARPSSRALYPIIDIFYRIPTTQLEELHGNQSFRNAVARLLHWTLLAPPLNQAELRDLIIAAHDINASKAAKEPKSLPVWSSDHKTLHEELRQAFQRYQEKLLEIWVAKERKAPLELNGLSLFTALNRLAQNEFESSVKQARSLQHSAVGWLYALERRGGACEFLWIAQEQGYIDRGRKVGVPTNVGDPREEQPLQRADGNSHLYPEKQHIVPFSIARQIFGKGGTRATSSPANAIGNLTWLSQRQNALDALSDRWTVMSREYDNENLRARGMLTKGQVGAPPTDALAVYETLSEMIIEGAWRENQERAQTLFKQLCIRRENWMFEEMSSWLNKRAKGSEEWLEDIKKEATAEAIT